MDAETLRIHRYHCTDGCSDCRHYGTAFGVSVTALRPAGDAQAFGPGEDYEGREPATKPACTHLANNADDCWDCLSDELGLKTADDYDC